MVPASLAKLFVCITFSWNITKLAYLEQSIANVKLYPTHVDVGIVTDEPAKLQNVLNAWGFRGVKIHGIYAPLMDKRKYALLWEHRAVMQNVSSQGYTSYMYLEDDTKVTWRAMRSWALDMEVLEPLGFMRGFYRTEFCPETGKLLMLDLLNCDYCNVNLDTYNRTVHVGAGTLSQRANSKEVPACKLGTVERGRFAQTSTVAMRTTAEEDKNPPCVNMHFVQLPRTYAGMWAATHGQLLRFMAHKLWDKEFALNFDLNFLTVPWGYPERSTGMIQLIDGFPKNGFWGSHLLPYDPVARLLISDAAISHQRNGYSNEYTMVEVDKVFVVPPAAAGGILKSFQLSKHWVVLVLMAPMLPLAVASVLFCVRRFGKGARHGGGSGGGGGHPFFPQGMKVSA